MSRTAADGWGRDMQVTETLRDGLKRSYEIKVSAAELEAKVNEKLAEAQPEIAMKGFRKGKVPMALLKKQFGPRILGEAMQESIDGAMNQHFESTGDRPALQPQVKMTNEGWQEGDDVLVSLAYEALPQIPETDLSTITLEKLVVKADDAAVAEALERLAGSARDFEDRPEGQYAENGDQVVLDFVGKIDGEPFEGGAAEDYPLVLGSGSFIPGFEPQLEGVKVGESRVVTVSFPEGYQAPHLAGKEATFDCTIKAVKMAKPAMLDDELAKKFGAEDLESLKAQIAERIEAEYAGASRTVLKRALLDKLDEMVSFELPPSLVAAEAHQIAHQLWHEEHADVHGHDHGAVEPNETHEKLAERRVRLGLFLADLGQKNKVEVTEAEMTRAAYAQARQYPGHERQFLEFLQSNAQMQQQLRAPIFEDKVVDLIFGIATVTDREVTKDELQEAVKKLEDLAD